MTASNGYNVTLRRISKDGTKDYTVTLATNSDEENWTKSLNVLTFPQDTNTQDTEVGKNTSNILDILNKAERRVTFTGYLATGINPDTVYNSLGVTADKSSDAEDKKNDLYKIFFAGGVFTVYYEGSSFQANSDKISVKRFPQDLRDRPVDGQAEFEVTLSVVVGVDLT